MTTTEERFSYARTPSICLSAIALLALGLFLFALTSIRKQPLEMSNLTVSNLRHSTKWLGMDLESNYWELAKICLQEAKLNLDSVLSDTTPKTANEIKDLFEKINARHSLARHWFVLQDGVVRFAFLQTPSQQRLQTYLGTQDPAVKLIRTIQDGFRSAELLERNGIYAQTFRHDSTNYLIFWTAISVNSGPETRLGFSADLPWIKSQMFAQSSRELDQDSELTASLKVIPNTKSNPAKVGENVTELRVPFKTLFPFWQMLVPESFVRDRQGNLHREIVFLAVSGLILFLVLGVAVVLLLRMDRLLKLSQSQCRFLNSVSHELKTPLALIWLYSEILLQENESYPKSERKVFCEIISRESERLSRLFEQLLNFGRIAGGQQRYHLREGDLGSEIALTVKTYAQHLKQRGFDVEMELAAQGSLTRFDSGAIRQVVLNLMDNARKYSGEAKFIRVRLRSKDHQVIFEVTDHGIGIPIEEQEKIFQEFYRYQVPQGPKRLGYGLGLFLVRHIMQAHDGKIELDSEVGRGSRFRLVFPVTTESKVEQRLAGSWPRSGCAKSLLRRFRQGAGATSAGSGGTL